MPPNIGDESRAREAAATPREAVGSPSYALGQLTWEEVAAAIRRDPRLIIPAGALEQHGPHLPLATNTLIAARVARDLSDQLRILLAPPLEYGATVPTNRRFAGAATLRRKTLHRVINDLLESWEEQGVREFVIITAHRYTPHLDALLMAFTSEASVRVIDLYGIEVADLLEGPAEAQHAGEVETSLVLYLYPDQVRTDRITDWPLAPKLVRKYVRGRLTTPPGGWTGVIGTPSVASAETGRRIYERLLDTIRAALAGGNP